MFNSRFTKAVAGLLTVATFAWAMGGVVPVAEAAQRHTDGTVVQIDSTIYKIEGGQLRGFSSADIFFSHGYKFSDARPATDGDRSLPKGSVMTWANGTLVADSGTVYMVHDGKARAFTSAAVFTGLGYSFSNVRQGSIAGFTIGAVVNSTTAAHPAGSLINASGTIFMVMENGIAGVPNMDVFNSYGWSFGQVVPANAADLGMARLANMTARANGGSLVNTDGTPVTPGTPGTTPGAEGTLMIDLLATPSSVDVEEGESNVSVMGFEVEAEDSAITLERIDVVFEAADTSSQRPWDYIDKVSIYQGSTLVKSMNVSGSDDFTEIEDNAVDNVDGVDQYRVRFSGLTHVVGVNSTQNFTVRVDASDSIDGTDLPQTFHVDILEEGVRGIDGAGIAVYNEDTSAHRTFIIDEEEAGDLVVSSNSDSQDDMIETADDEDTTEGVTAFMFDVEANDQDVTVDDVTIDVTTVGPDTDHVINTVHLYHGTTLLGSENVPDAGATTDEITFEDLDFEIEADEEVTLTVKVDANELDGTIFAQGDSVEISVDSGAITGEDALGDDVTSTGTATGGAISFFTDSISVELNDSEEPTATKSFSADAATEVDNGTFVITFDVTANGEDMYIDRSTDVTGADCAVEANAAGQGVEFCFNTTNAATMTVLSENLEAEGTESADNTNTFFVPEGSTRTFTLTVVAQPSADTSAQMVIESINWGTASGDTNANYYTIDLGDFKTPYLFLNVF
jgi:hypothetical protein